MTESTGSRIPWRQPDATRIERRRLASLAAAERVVIALNNAGYEARVYGSVLRSAHQPFGFHPHSDLDLLVVHPANLMDPCSGHAGILATAESDVRPVRLSCLLVPESQSELIRPFDPAEILRRSLKRLKERSAFLQRLLVRSQAAGPRFDAGVYEDAAGYQLGEVQKCVDRILKLVVHGHIGWLPEIDGPFSRRAYREVLVELAAGAAGTSPLICARELAQLRSGFIGATLSDVGLASVDLTASVSDLLPILHRLVDAFAGSAEGSAG